ncbi:hypothetical protein ACTVZO_01260 [Streptomyces sp. IBSNAI002]|uniref:hypothetical protein n=1 Tax=Streptomyces sp. IBSNAI002 TaxID=3457500 RepID=UPI003FD2C1DA
MRVLRKTAIPAITASLLAVCGFGVQVATATASHADSRSCDELKRVLDAHSDASSPNMYASGAYISAYLAAKAAGCSFLSAGNTYHVTGTKPDARPNSKNLFGENFRLQTEFDSTHKCSTISSGRGIFIDIDGDGKLRGKGNIGCSGDNEPANILHGNAEFAWQSVTYKDDDGNIRSQQVAMDDQSIRQLYRLVVMTGPHAGKCAGIEDPNSANPVLRTASCETNKTYFAPQSGSPKAGGDVLDAMWISDTDQLHKIGLSLTTSNTNVKHLGVIDIAGKQRTGDAVVYKYTGDWNQKYFYRPLDYRD